MDFLDCDLNVPSDLRSGLWGLKKCISVWDKSFLLWLMESHDVMVPQLKKVFTY